MSPLLPPVSLIFYVMYISYLYYFYFHFFSYIFIIFLYLYTGLQCKKVVSRIKLSCLNKFIIIIIIIIIIKSSNHSSVAILCLCVYALNRNKHEKLYLPSIFLTLDIELLSPKIET